MKHRAVMSQLPAVVSSQHQPITFSLALFFIYSPRGKDDFCLILKKQRSGMLPMGIKVSCWFAVLAVTSTVFLTFSFWKWHLWHSLSESNVFTSVGTSSPSPEQTAAVKTRKVLSLCRQLVVTRLRDFVTPGRHERPLLMLYLAQRLCEVFFSGFPFIALNLAKPALTQTRMWQ